MDRRHFLRLSGTFFAVATVGRSLAACGDDGGNSQPTGLVGYPQGLASGDPRETSVVLWTRAVDNRDATADVALRLDVATDSDFADVVATQDVTATATSDHTVRVIVSSLTADTLYYYRFVAGGDVISGRTRTAPAADANVPIRLAWVSCQDYGAGRYDAYKLLVAEDQARAEADQIRFVLHLGDWIYETRADSFQTALDDNLEPIALTNADGSPRVVPPFPSGGGTAAGSNFAQTVDDYRHLYKVFGSDPDVMAARARWPFVHTWDDHEVANDYWQSMANYDNVTSLDEPSQPRKLAASQAWFEYVPMQLTGAPGVTGVTQHAHDFATATVATAPFTAPDDTNFVTEANNAAAVGAITIYRSLRFGQHVELIVTDERSYRSDHAVPEEFSHLSIEYLDPRNVLPVDDVTIMDAGRTANGGNPPAQVGISSMPNPRRGSPPGTMLGAQQKAWWKDSMKQSSATWKLWANEVPLMRFFIPKGPVGGLIVDRLMDGDAWDGYQTERNELMAYLRAQQVKNVVLLSGDIHAHFAGIVMDDYTAATPMPVAVELAAAGVSSNSEFSFYEDASRGSGVPADVRSLVTYDASGSGGPRFVENLNLLLLHGAASARTMATTNDLAMALAASAPPNPHLRYADTNAQGFGVALVSADKIDAELVTVERPIGSTAAVKRRAAFSVGANDPGGLTGPVISGTKPFPFT
ncbi:MAG TPA: alkaline phosphatase D family protein [Kofleriaceae bacterium]|nr:alkaline phosphatase D family protein [Kofleriaceae bacterium]